MTTEVKFNYPEKRNCMSPKRNRQMMRAPDALEFREDVGVVVLDALIQVGTG
jgi:feruloyl-CoA hydratase/lyase